MQVRDFPCSAFYPTSFSNFLSQKTHSSIKTKFWGSFVIILLITMYTQPLLYSHQHKNFIFQPLLYLLSDIPWYHLLKNGEVVHMFLFQLILKICIINFPIPGLVSSFYVFYYLFFSSKHLTAHLITFSLTGESFLLLTRFHYF